MKSGTELRPYGFFNHPYRKFNVGIFKRDHGEQKTFYAAPVQWIEQKENQECPPLLSIDFDEAQLLVDALWDAGLRPTQGNGSAGQLQATEKHLSDLQLINAKLLQKILER